MSLRETFLQAVRTLLKSALTLTDAQVVPTAHHPNKTPRDRKTVRPSLPYLTVHVLVPEISVGGDEHRYGLADDGTTPTHFVSGLREGTVAINGYGEDTSDWLMRFNLALLSPSIQAQFETLGLTVLQRAAGLTDLSGVLDTGFEPRFLAEHTIRYQLVSTPTNQVALVTAGFNFTIHETADVADDADPLTLSASLPVHSSS